MATKKLSIFSIVELIYFAVAIFLCSYSIYVDIETITNANSVVIIPPNAIDHWIPKILLIFIPATVVFAIRFWVKKQFLSLLSPLLLIASIVILVAVSMFGVVVLTAYSDLVLDFACVACNAYLLIRGLCLQLWLNRVCPDN